MDANELDGLYHFPSLKKQEEKNQIEPPRKKIVAKKIVVSISAWLKSHERTGDMENSYCARHKRKLPLQFGSSWWQFIMHQIQKYNFWFSQFIFCINFFLSKVDFILFAFQKTTQVIYLSFCVEADNKDLWKPQHRKTKWKIFLHRTLYLALWRWRKLSDYMVFLFSHCDCLVKKIR